MPYAKFDDRYDDHRKVKRAWRRFPPNPVGLHAMAITYCNRHETDGLIDVDWLEEKVPKQSERERIVEFMVKEEMLDRVDDERFYVHGFLDWNDSREHREQLREAGRKGANARWNRKGNRSGDANADRSWGASAEANGPPHHTTPHHTEPPRPPAGGGRERDWVRFADRMRDWAASSPPSADEEQRVAALLDELPDNVWTRRLHAHGSPNGRLVLGIGVLPSKSDPDPTGWVRDRYGKAIEAAVGAYELVACGCPAVEESEPAAEAGAA
jgi:hypothetical protein